MTRKTKTKNSLRYTINSSERKELKIIHSDIKAKRKVFNWIKSDEQ